MRLVDFAAEADIVGKRVRISWRIVDIQPGELTAGSEPDLTLLGKVRDFDYANIPGPSSGVVYRSSEFPPDDPDLGVNFRVDEMRRPPVRDETGRVLLVDVVSLSRRMDIGRDDFLESLRRTRTSVLGPDGTVVERRDEILDYGGGGGPPNVTRYYELRGSLVDASQTSRPRAVATPTAPHRTARYLYDQLPGVWRRHSRGRGRHAGDRRRRDR